MALSYPQIDPVAIDLGPLQVHWYGLMYLFGFLGSLMFIVGFLSAFLIGLFKLLHLYVYKTPAMLITDNPLFYTSLVSMVIGSQLFLAGFLGEMILRTDDNKNRYIISKEID